MIENDDRWTPVVPDSAWVHALASVSGDVVLGERTSVWPAAVLRGDQGAIRIGAETNIQDGAVLHATGGISEVHVGARCTVGHRAVLHGCRIGERCLIGMGSIVLDNAEIGDGSVIGAGALVTAGTRVPPGSLVLGAPARVVGPVTEKQDRAIDHGWRTYVRLKDERQRVGLPGR
jgi:carbonic anhydrase/acetyltransferase-like protein (isoleucine patch superfamily)